MMSLVLGLGLFVSSASAQVTGEANHCLVTCRTPDAQGRVRSYFGGAGTCSNGNGGACGAFCIEKCGSADAACSGGDGQGMRCVAQVTQVNPATSPGTCGFQCGDQQNFNAVQGCTTDADCVSTCAQVCAAVSNVACAQSPQPRCVPRSGGSTASAPTTPSNASGRLSNPLGTTDLRVIGGRVARSLIGILGAVALLMFVVGGILWMTAGDSKRVDQAKLILVNSLIGILLVFFAYFISVAVLAFFGAS